MTLSILWKGCPVHATLDADGVWHGPHELADVLNRLFPADAFPSRDDQFAAAVARYFDETPAPESEVIDGRT